MKPNTLTLALAATALTLSAGTAVAQDSTVKRIVRGGVDGDRTSYVVSCVDGGRASVFVKHSTEETCAVPRNGTPQCQKEGLLRDAAELACKAPTRG